MAVIGVMVVESVLGIVKICVFTVCLVDFENYVSVDIIYGSELALDVVKYQNVIDG